MEDYNTLNFDMPKNRSSVIKVIGVGGGGSNAVNYMKLQGIRGVDFIICNTDVQALEYSSVENKVQLGVNLTEGLGAGADPEIGEKAALESYSNIQSVLGTTTKMVFITAGMGGGTGTGAAPIIAKAAKELDILTIGIVTVPFHFEGGLRLRQAENGVEKLKKHVDSLIVINNNKLREVYGNLGFKTGFNKADEVLATAAKGIAEVITHHYNVNIDLRDAKTVLKDSGTAIMGSSKASGPDRAIKSVQAALDSPLLNDNHIHGALHVLLLIVSGNRKHEITFDEIGEINDYIQNQAGKQVDIIMGIGEDEKLDDALQVTIVATGFNSSNPIGIIKPAEQKRVIHGLNDEIEQNINDISKHVSINSEVDSNQFDLFQTENTSFKNEPLDNFHDLKVIEEPINNEEIKNLENEDEQVIYQLEDEDDNVQIRFETEESNPKTENQDKLEEEYVDSEKSLSEINNVDPNLSDREDDNLAKYNIFEEPIKSEESSINMFDAFSLDAPNNEHIPEISPQEEPNSPIENQKINLSGADKNISAESETNAIKSTHDLEHDIMLNSDNDDVQLNENPSNDQNIQQFSLEDLRALEDELLDSNETKKSEEDVNEEIIDHSKSSSHKASLRFDISEHESNEIEPEKTLEFQIKNENISEIPEFYSIDPDKDNIDLSMKRLANQRRAYLQNFNHQFGKNIKMVAMNEDEWEKPSFKRNGIDINRTGEDLLEDDKKSNTGLSGQDNDIEFTSHNSFLHDNVD
jgi:cell division protein FtsZ